MLIKKLQLLILVLILSSTALGCKQRTGFEILGDDPTKQAVITDFLTLYAVFDSYKQVHKNYPESLWALTEDNPPWVDKDLGSGKRGYYIYEYTRIDKDRFEIIARDLGVEGGTVFYMCQDGYIKLDDARGKVIYRSPIAEKKERMRLIWLVGIPVILLIGLFYFKRH